MMDKSFDVRPKILLKLDSDSIHEYIFSTSKLRQIQRASELIDDLIFNLLPREMGDDQADALESTGKDLHLEEKIIQGGGNLLVEYSLPATTPDDGITEIMDKLVGRLCDFYEQETCGATITGEWVRYEKEKDFAAALEKLNEKIALKKGIPKLSGLLPGGSYLKRCESCGKGTCDISGIIFDRKSGSNRYLCAGCANKEKNGSPISEEGLPKGQTRQRLYNKTERWIEYWTKYAANAWGKMDKEEYYRLLPVSFEDMVKGEKEGEMWLGLIYFDGNGMGETISAIRQKEKLKKFSKQVDEALNRSVIETLSSLFPYPKNGEKAQFNVLMLGGDDLVLLIKAKKACQAARQIIDKFEKYTAKDGFPLTASAGIVFFHYKYPISKVIHAGKELLKNAKRHACEESIKKMLGGRELPGSTIDFTILSDPGSENPETYRKKLRERTPACAHDVKRPYLFCRPYEVSAFRDLLKSIKKLKEEGLSSSRLNRLRQGVFAGRSRAMYSALHAIAHGTDPKLQKQLKDTLRDGGGRKPIDIFEPPYIVGETEGEVIRRTVVLDIADLFQFVRDDNMEG
ncbi:hypothetical protein J7M07_08625 [bacterium]|nr:hypothetical protein [bacterium]